MNRNTFRKTPFALALSLCFGVGVVHAQETPAPPPSEQSAAPAAAAPEAMGPAAPAETAAPAESAPTASADDGVEEIVVFSIRKALASATEAKREATAFTDSIFAEDIGKLPSNNIAETLNRIPGVQITRDQSGEGTQVSVRGLGSSFTRVLLNNTQISLASDGGTDGGNGNREVDLDLFPTELFTRLDVNKTPTAAQIEGGIAGVINMRNARPFDNPGMHVNYVAQGAYNQAGEDISPRGALIASNTWDDFGVLVGVAAARTQLRTDAFETLGWTDGCLVATGTCGLGNNNFRYAVNAPNNVPGLTPGEPLDLEDLSGLSSEQLDQALIPRLGRYASFDGERDRVSGVAALQYQPSDDLHFNLDTFYATAQRDFTRISSNWSVRNSSPGTTGGMVPIDLEVDENNVVTSGTFANSRFFVEARPINDDLDFYNINPSMMMRLNDFIVMDAQVNYGKSTFFREAPSFLFDTPRESGITVSYVNDGGATPSITPNANLNDPNLGWIWNRVNIQNVRRETENKGGRLDFTFGERNENVKLGAAYDDIQRDTVAYDNSAAYQAYICGASCATADGAVPNSQLAQYLQSGPGVDFSNTLPGSLSYSNWIIPDFDALKEATNYDFYNRTAPVALNSSQGTPTGFIHEKTLGSYAEFNTKALLLERNLFINAGVRYVHTEQMVRGPANVSGQTVYFSEETTYEEFLPAFNASFEAAENVKLRIAGSRTMTRPNPSDLLPGVTFSDPSAQTARSGNPQLTPYTSNNFDIGGEYYTGDEGYVGVTFFNKVVDGFTDLVATDVVFSDLGIAFESLTTQQQQAIMTNGGPDAAPVILTQPQNLNEVTLRGTELTWLQPLDLLLRGLGFQANFTHISQKTSGDYTIAGISPNTYNFSAYYEDYGVAARVTYTHADGGVSQNGPQNALPYDMRYDKSDRVDMTLSYLLPFFNGEQRITLDAFNITNEEQRSTIGRDNMPYSLFAPGYSVVLGLRGSF